MATTQKITLPAPAKINLFLHVLNRRTDGYHNLQTAFQFIDLCDDLIFEPNQSGQITINVQGAHLNQDDNLVMRAAKALHPFAKSKSGVEISLKKRIPIGAGLGGGSSNAATTLIGLNILWQCDLSQQQLLQIGLTLGADVPIFIFGHAAFAEGVGEKLQKIEPNEPWYLVVKPPCSVSTAEIFSHPRLTRDHSSITIGDLTGQTDMSQMGNNDCEAVAKDLHPEIDAALTWLNQHTSARMTGTGSSVFGQFSDYDQAQDVIRQLPKPFLGFVTKGMNVSSLHRILPEYLENIGTSPSGKALGFDLSMRRFESCRPSHSTLTRPTQEET